MTREERRAYNRDYMRRWRQQHHERYLRWLRHWRRRRARPRCYWCRRPATTVVERLDPRRWQAVLRPYCGVC